MQVGIPGTNEVVLIAFWIVFYGVLALAGVRIFGWLVDRQTKELRQRVALLEHEVAELQEERDDEDTTGFEFDE